ARVAALAEARAALRATRPEPLDEARREQAIAAALDAFDQTGRSVPVSEPTPSAAVTDLAAVAARRSQGSTRRLRLVAAAAVVALVALAVPVIGSLSSGDSSEDLASIADEADEDTQSGAEDFAEPGTARDKATGAAR